MTIAPGLCSITLRALSADEVLHVAERAGVAGIEWGADGHAPPGGGAQVEALGRRCRDAGIDVVSYGSYLGFGPTDKDDRSSIDAALDTAEALGVPMVRIWSEFGIGPAAPPSERARVTERTAAYADSIAKRGLTTALEFHPYTLTETAASANALLDALNRVDVRTHWQPDPALSNDEAITELELVKTRLAHFHVFAWGPTGIDDRHPLSEGEMLWTSALEVAKRISAPVPGGCYALCEYVRNDDPEQLVVDVATLRAWLAKDS